MARKRQGHRDKHTGSYYFDKKTRQHQWSIEHDGKRYRVKDRDETAARIRFAELTRRLFGGVDVRGARTLLSEYLPRWIDTEVTGKQATRDDYHKRADLYILPTFGSYAIGDIKRRHVVAWVDAMMNTPDAETGRLWARTSIKQALGLMRRALEAAIPEFIEHNPAAGVKVPMRRRGEEYQIDAAPATQPIFTPDQMRAFLAEVQRTDHRHGLYVYYLLLAELGPRRGEGLGLRRKDINVEERTIRIAQQVTRNPVTNATAITTPKSEAGKRELPVSEALIKLLLEQCRKVGASQPDALVFPNKNGVQRQPNSVTQHFRRTCQRLGFVGYTLHSLRKYAVTDWRKRGIDLEVAAAMAGHAGVNVTANVYSQPTMDRKRAAFEHTKPLTA